MSSSCILTRSPIESDSCVSVRLMFVLLQHANIGLLALANDVLESALTKATLLKMGRGNRRVSR